MDLEDKDMSSGEEHEEEIEGVANAIRNYESDENDGVGSVRNPNDPGERLLKAAEAGKNIVISKILEEDPNLVHYQDQDGYSALHRAAYCDRSDTIRLLIQKGAKIECKTEDGWTALHSASRWNAYHAVRALLDNGADINAKTLSNITPLHNAANYRNKEVAIMLLMSPFIETDIRTGSGQTAYDIAVTGELSYLFQMTQYDSLNKI